MAELPELPKRQTYAQRFAASPGPGVGKLLSQTFSIYFANFLPFTLVTLLALVPVILASAVFASILENQSNRERLLELVLLYAGLVIVLGLILTPIATGAVTYGVVQQVRGRHASFGDCLQVGLSRIFPVIGVALLQGLIIGVGVLLCCIPGLIALTVLYAAVPAAVIEGTGPIESLRRSADLTRGNRLHIFLMAFVLGLIDGALDRVLDAVLEHAPTMISLVVPQILGAVTSALVATAGAVVYYEQRRAKEGVDADQLAAVFS